MTTDNMPQANVSRPPCTYRAAIYWLLSDPEELAELHEKMTAPIEKAVDAAQRIDALNYNVRINGLRYEIRGGAVTRVYPLKEHGCDARPQVFLGAPDGR